MNIRVSEVLSNTGYLELLNKLKSRGAQGLRASVDKSKKIEELADVIHISASQASALTKVGTGFVKYAHKIWKLKKNEGNGEFVLERSQPEKNSKEFENDVDVSAENLYRNLSGR